jgi:hypothetical protein
LHLLSAAPDQVSYGKKHFEQHSENTSSILAQLFEGYRREGLAMAYTTEDFQRDYARQHLKDLTPEERLEGLSAKERVKGLTPKEVLQALSPEELLQALSADEIDRYLRQRKQRRPSPKAKKGRS